VKRLLLVLAVLLSLCASLSQTTFVTAEARPDWLSGEPVARVSGDGATREDADAAMSGCSLQTVRVHDYDPRTECVTQMDGWRYADYTHFYSQWGMTVSEHFFVVGIGSDSKMYVVDGLPTSVAPLNNPGSTVLTYRFDNGAIQIYRHFLDYLERTENGYRLSDKAPDLARYSSGEVVNANAVAISRGGDWLIAETPGGIVRVNLLSLATASVAPITAPHNVWSPDAMELAISNDGETVAIGGRLNSQRQFWIIHLDEQCVTINENTCGKRDLTPLFNEGYLPEGFPVSVRLSPQGRRLDFYIARGGNDYTRAALYPYGSAPYSLRYLALGDSYSSGEGDGDTSYYLSHTDNVDSGEICHLSSRSYPYRLAEFGGLNAFNGLLRLSVKSVACSGARISDIFGTGSYLGQTERLKGLPSRDITARRTNALSEFIPGRIRQSDFVEEYQPQAVSLTIGGNDIQFSNIIKACVISPLTCSYANDPTDRRNLGESIKALYPRLTALYAELSRMDSGSKVSAVGYPRFVNETNDACPLTTNLDYAERTMIDEGVRYLNEIIRAAAVTAGVGYVDIEDALVDHRACDTPGGYVNELNFADIRSKGVFHPNELGQLAIALAIERQAGGDLALHNYCASNRYPCAQPTNPPVLPSFFGDESFRPLYLAIPSELVQITDSVLPFAVTRKVEFMIHAAHLAAGSVARIALHSEPLDLGAVTVGTDGSLRMSLTLPDTVEAGYHTLHVYGISPSGEAVDMYQIIYVRDGVEEPEQEITSVSSSIATPPRTDLGPLSETGVVPCFEACQTSNQSLHSVVIDTIIELPKTVGRFWQPALIACLLTAGLILSRLAQLLWRSRRT